MKKTRISIAAVIVSLALTQAGIAGLKVKVDNSSTQSDSTQQVTTGETKPDGVHGKPKNENQDKPDESDPPVKAVNHYGKGDTIRSRENYLQEHGALDHTATDKWGTTHVEGETRTGELRSRTYEENGFLKRTVGTQHQANLVRSRYETNYESGAAKVGDVEVARYRSDSEVEGFVGAQADAEAGFDLASTDPRAEAKAGVFVGARVDVSSTQTVEVLGASASTTMEGSASVGAEAAVEAGVSKDGAEAKAGAFAGARAEGSVGGEVAGVGATGSGEAWAGVGAEAEATAKFEDGKLTFGTEAGAALGVGGKVGYEATIDVNKVHNDGKTLFENGGKLVDEVVPDLDTKVVITRPRFDKPVASLKLPKVQLNKPQRGSSAAVRSNIRKAANQVTQRNRQTAKTVNRIAKDVTRGAGTASKSASRATKSVGNDFIRAAKNTGKAASNVGEKTGGIAKNAGKTASGAGRKVSGSVKKAGKKAGKASKSIGKGVKNLFK